MGHFTPIDFLHPYDGKVLQALMSLSLTPRQAETELVTARFISEAPCGWKFVAQTGENLDPDTPMIEQGVGPGATIAIVPAETSDRFASDKLDR